VREDKWALKIVAFLHDPPDKPFGIGGHRERANELMNIALGRDPSEDEIRRVEEADRIASAADRVDFPADSEAYWYKETAFLTHPLSGRLLDPGKITDVNTSDTHRAAKEALQRLIQDIPELRCRYLRLWRLLPEILADEYPKVGTLFGMLPADTRQPDHPLLQHLSITAAIATALPHPALLVFSIGPVQSFIAAARRTQDLWMGSWLLSFLAWTAMETIAESYGPDAVIFPSLRRQPLCDLWLHSQGVIPDKDKPHPEKLALASLPNKFVALLPASEAEQAAQRAEEAVQDKWHKFADEVRVAIEQKIPRPGNAWEKLWQAQIDTQLEIYWSIFPWPGEGKTLSKEQAEDVRKLFSSLALEPESFRVAYEHYVKSGKYRPNWGTTYSLLYTLADRAFNARKNLRDFVTTEEKGEKCTLCGQRAVLHGKDTSRIGVREFWSDLAEKLDKHIIKAEGRERLCAVCTVKRLVQQKILADRFGLKRGFPSTSEIAVTPFKKALIENLDSNSALLKALQRYLKTLDILGFPSTVAINAVPKLQQMWKKAPVQLKDIVNRLLKYDGSILFAETFEPDRLYTDYGLKANYTKIHKCLASLRELLDVAEDLGIVTPPKYYAILTMDGDHAGRWLSGTHKGLTELGRVLHPRVEEELREVPGWEELLKAKRLMTPSLHAAISDALASFALKVVRYVIEERHTGRVIYAGGDDVLAFLPLEDALSAARELRALFSGEIKLLDPSVPPKHMDLRKQEWEVAFCDPSCTGYLRLDGEILLTMGPTSSASIGIAIAHHLQPLDAVMEAARQAEHAAKDRYERNAVCVHLLKRSGEETRVGAKWFYSNGVPDSIQLITDIVQRFQKGELAMRLSSTLFQETRTLAGMPVKAQQAELKRLLWRHLEERLPKDYRQKLAEEFAEKLAFFAMALDEHSRKVEKSGFEQMADWLRLARFLAQGGEE